jgi:hypothetical protein
MIMRGAVRNAGSPERSGGRLARAAIIVVGLQLVSLVGQPSAALADCATGDGNITSPGTCTTPQTLTGSTGTIVSGATLTTGANTTAYTVSANNATITNSGTVTSQGPQAFLTGGTGAIVNLTNSGSITAPAGNGIFVTAGGSINIVNRGTISGVLDTPAGNTFGPDITAGGAIVIAPAGFSGAGGGTITQAAGTIDGGIFLSGDSVVNVTGGTITGPIADRTRAGGGAGSSQNRGAPSISIWRRVASRLAAQ